MAKHEFSKFVSLLIFVFISSSSQRVLSQVIYQPGFHLPEIASQNFEVTAENINALISVDIETGKRSLFSGIGRGNGPMFVNPGPIVLDEINARFVLWDWSLNRFFSIDRHTGDREHLSPVLSVIDDDFIGGFDPYSGNAYAITRSATDAYQIDMETGELHQLKLFNGDDFTIAVYVSQAIFLESEIVVLLRDHRSNYSLASINLLTGKISEVSGLIKGSGMPLSIGIDMKYVSSKDKVLLSDSNSDLLLGVHMLSGDRKVISSKNLGLGPATEFPGAIILDDEEKSAYLATGGFIHIVQIDLESGDRKLVSAVETNPNTLASKGAFDRENHRIVFVNKAMHEVPGSERKLIFSGQQHR